MTLPDRMKALLLNHEGYSSTPTPSALEAMEPYVTLGEIGVPRPGPSQVLVKVKIAAVNPSDVMFLKGQYGQPRIKGQPAGFEGVGEVVAAGENAAAQALIGKRVAFPELLPKYRILFHEKWVTSRANVPFFFVGKNPARAAGII